MKIELDLNNLLGIEYDEDGDAIGQRDLRSEVVKLAASTLVDEVRRDAKAAIQTSVTEVVMSEIRDVVRAVLSQPIQKATPWGEKKGVPTSVMEMIRTQIEEFLSSTASRRRDSYDRTAGNLTELIEDSVKGVLSKELTSEINSVRKTINTRISDHALKAAAEALTVGLKV